jgi:hypothetical protein
MAAMMTPGRTHLPWQDTAGHIRELINYIGYLEAKVRYLESHHGSCPRSLATDEISVVSQSYSPPSVVFEDKDPQFQDVVGNSSDAHVPSSDTNLEGFVFVSHDNQSQLIPGKKTLSGVPRWKRIIQTMYKGWEHRNSWEQKRKSIGIDTIERNHAALASILGPYEQYLSLVGLTIIEKSKYQFT